MRGEYFFRHHPGYRRAELPPRARRILAEYAESLSITGTTSACAENTPYGCMPTRKPGNYLRVRGEYTRGGLPTGRTRELPPRARRIPLGHNRFDRALGTTSACAENTPHANPTNLHAGNYLRVRGEYLLMGGVGAGEVELPPRARRILNASEVVALVLGTTSACAENTPLFFARQIPKRNYLRVRGEYPPAHRTPGTNLELPPRARRIRNANHVADAAHGTTSACAENTGV